jgi:hypothetical protein
MSKVIELEIAGMGIIFYSPWAVEHIQPNSDYLSSHFSDATEVGNQVCACSLTGFCTGSSGIFKLHLSTESVDEVALQATEFKIALGLEVREKTVCFRDLYDLMKWEEKCPEKQTFSLENGFYHITAHTSTPQSGLLGDGQVIHLCFRLVPERPELTWQGVPQLC